MNRVINTLPPIAQQPDERGSALIGALLLLMMMSALAAAMAVGGQTETLISRNERSATQAQAAAEAGLNHAVELATTFIFNYNANGFASTELAIAALLRGPDGVTNTADDGSLAARVPGITAPEAIPLAGLTMPGGSKQKYEASVVDDTAPDENDGNPLNDVNGTVIVRATGYAQDNTKVVLEAMISSSALPGALVTCGDVSIGGSAHISGAEGDVYATGTVSLLGSADVDGTVTSGAVLTCPSVKASDYKHFADYVLKSDGTKTKLDGTACGAPCNGWTFSSGTWTGGNSITGGSYYVEGKVTITGSPGSAKNPLLLTLIAEGSISISSHPHIMPDTPELLFVTNGDLDISGAIDTGDPLTAGGQMLVHEQLHLLGNPSLVGQLIVENATSVDPLVTANSIGGNVDIIYNGGLGEGGGASGGGFQVTGWQEVR